MPECFRALATGAAAAAGYPGFVPDACLINRYAPGTRLSLHQDRDERDHAHPIVSVSLGLPATFQFGELKRSDPVRKGSARRCGGVGRSVAARLSRHRHAEGGRERASRQPTHQLDVPPSVTRSRMPRSKAWDHGRRGCERQPCRCRAARLAQSGPPSAGPASPSTGARIWGTVMA